jgi:hypothetical protein
MKRHRAGATVEPGLYWRPRSRDVRVVSRQAGVLEGEAGTEFLRIPTAAIPLAGAIALAAGALYVLLLPLIGTGALVAACAARVWSWLVGHSVAPSGPLRGLTPHDNGRPRSR